MKKNKVIMTIITWVIIICAWFVVTETHAVSSNFIPSPGQVLKAFQDIIKNGYNGVPFWEHLKISGYRLFVSSFLAILVGVPLGLISGTFATVRNVVDSVINFYRPLPPLAYYTLLILWMGIDESSKIMLLFLAAFAPIYLSSASAVANVNPNFLRSAQSLGASKWSLFVTVIIPSSLPELFSGIRIAVGIAYTTLVSAEMVAATSGVGWMVIDASRYLRSDIMFVGIIVMGVTGILLDSLLKLIENRLIFWKGKE